MYSFFKDSCFTICKTLLVIGLLTQVIHNILDILGLKHFFHHQVEVELLLTLTSGLVLYNCFRPIQIKERFKNSYQIFLLIGIFANAIIATILTITEMVEILEEEFGLIQGLITFVLLNSIFSLTTITLKYKEILKFSWKKLIFYELISILVISVINLVIDPLLSFIDIIGYDIVFYALSIFVLILWKKNKIIGLWEKQRLLLISLSTVSFILLWQTGLLGI